MRRRAVARNDDATKDTAGSPAARPVFARRRPAVVACGVLLGGLLSSAAWAQVGMGPTSPVGGGNMGGSRGRSEPEQKPAEPPPDAIPGAKARAPAAPASRPIGDMAPTDALFDAINRGDITAARDSLNRGADLDAINVLGMTPMELSVDLGRNDISFLLLSMRGEDSGRGSRAVGRDAPAGQPAPKTVAAAKHPAGKPAVRGNSVATTTRPATTPKLLANDGGTPLPSAGFLGFDSRASTN
jgi:hypothetical protein